MGGRPLAGSEARLRPSLPRSAAPPARPPAAPPHRPHCPPPATRPRDLRLDNGLCVSTLRRHLARPVPR